MLLKIKFAVFSAIIIASGATETTIQTAVGPQSGTTELDNIEAAADSTNRDLYGDATDDDVNRRENCPDDAYCETYEQCRDSEAAELFGFNPKPVPDDRRQMGGCVRRSGGIVHWIVPANFDVFRSNAPPRYSRVCCFSRPIEQPTESPTQSPTWLDDSWGGDKWDGGTKTSWSGGNNKWGWSGGSSSSNQWGSNKWGWSGGSSNNNQWSNNKWGWSNKNDDWGGWEPSMNQWNHDGWHHDGWQDDGWQDDGFKKNSGWGWKDDGNNKRTCDLSDCCLARCEGTDFAGYRRFKRTSNGNDQCIVRRNDLGTGQRQRCTVRGYCYATGEGCKPSDCRC